MIQQATTPKIVKGLPAEEYHALPDWAHSKLKLLPDNPEEFYARYIAADKPIWARAKKPTRDMELGTAFHGMLLEKLLLPIVPEDVLGANGAMSTSAAKAFKRANPDCITQAEHDILKYAVDRCRQDPEIAAYLDTDGDVEASIFWADGITGLPCRGRVDKACRFSDGLSVFDVKFSAGNDKQWVEKQVATMLYYRQAAFYWDACELAYGAPVREFVFLFAKNSPPFDAYLWRMNPVDIELGRRRNRMALDDLRRRIETNDWHTKDFGTIRNFDLPKWAWDEGPQSIEPFEIFNSYEGESV